MRKANGTNNGKSAPARRPRVLLLGYGETGPAALAGLLATFDVAAVVTPPAGDALLRRGPRLPIEDLATARGVRVVRTNSNDEIGRLVTALRPAAVVISSYNKVLPAALLARTRFINVHHGDLPRWRGRANINWAIILGRKEIGLTIHEAVPDLDAGRIYSQKMVPIGAEETVADVYAKFNASIEARIGAIVGRVLAGAPGRAQDGRATYCCTRLPEDGLIDWSRPTKTIRDLVRGVTRPFPGAFTYFDGDPIKVWATRLVAKAPKYEGRIPGRVVRVVPGQGVEVLTGDGIVLVTDVTFRGRDCLASDVIKTTRATLGLDAVAAYEALRIRVQELERQLRRQVTEVA